MEVPGETTLIAWIAWSNLAVSIPIFLILFFWIPSPYGKLLPQEQQKNWMTRSLGPRFPAKWSWMLFESPNLLWAGCCWIWKLQEQPAISSLPNVILFAFFTLHYLQRGIYYPLCMSSSASKPVPLLVFVSALVFCTCNG